MTQEVSQGILSKLASYYEREGFQKTVRRSSYEIATCVDAPWMFLSWVLPGPTNVHEIRVIAQRRTGHHAIVNWIRAQLKGRYCFLNNCRANGNPFLTCQRGSSIISNSLLEHSWNFWNQEVSGKLSKKGTLLYNYEDQLVSEVASEDFQKHRTQWLGKSLQRTDILIMRDPFNLLASRLKWVSSLGFEFEPDKLIKTWKEHAYEFLGETSYLSNKVTVSYNKWFCDRDYRQRLSSELGLEWNDRGMQQVAKWGPTISGGSFDGLTYDGKAQQMRVLERWKQYVNNQDYFQSFKNEEVFELSKRIFGEIEGTDILLRK